MLYSSSTASASERREEPPLKITQEEVVDNQTTLHIELEDDDLVPYLDRGYRRIANQVSVPGFRKGKAPRTIVEGLIGRESILNEILDAMVSETVVKAVDELGLDSMGMPRVDDLDLDPVQFTAVVPLSPQIDLGDYHSIRIEYQEPEVSDEDVTQRIDAIRESMGEWSVVDRPAQFGDLTSIDMSSDVDGQTPWSAEDDTFYVAEDGRYPVPGFSQHIVSADLGEPVEFTLQIPEDHNDVSLAGKEASFSVTVKEVRERALPELTDEWAQSLPDGFEGIEALTNAVREALAANTTMEFENGYRNDAIEALVDGSDLLIAPVVVQTETERIQDEQNVALERSNIQRSDYLAAIGKTEEEAEQEAREEAEQRVRRNIVITKLAEREGIEATDSEIDERFNQMYGGQRMRRQQRRALRQELAIGVRIEKTVDLLVSIAKGERDTQTQNEDTTQEDSTDASPTNEKEEGPGHDDSQA